MSPFMKKEECAAYLKTVKPRTLVKWAWLGKIPARKHGSEWVFLRPEIEAWSAARANGKRRGADPSPSRFQAARLRLRSLKTQYHDAEPVPTQENRTG